MDNVIKPSARWRVGRKYRDGNVRWSPWSKNLICKGYAELVGGLLTQGTPSSYQISGTPVNFSAVPLYMAVGTGQASWDTAGVPVYTPIETHLVNEVDRKACVVRGYQQDGATELSDPISGASAPSTIRRPVLSASWNTTALVTISDPIAIREVGLIGGPGAATVGGTPQYLINLLRFSAPISKGSADPFTMTLECEIWVNFE